MLFHTKMTALRQGAQISTDRYGLPIYGPDVEIAFRGELISPATDESFEANRNPVVTSFRALYPRTVQLGSQDKIHVLGEDYEIVGTPMPIMVRGHLHHYEAQIQRMTG